MFVFIYIVSFVLFSFLSPGNKYNICCGRVKNSIVSTTLHGREELPVIGQEIIHGNHTVLFTFTWVSGYK